MIARSVSAEAVELVLLFMLLDGDADVEIVFKLDDQPGVAGDVQRLGYKLELPSDGNEVMSPVSQGERVVNRTEIVMGVGMQVPNA